MVLLSRVDADGLDWRLGVGGNFGNLAKLVKCCDGKKIGDGDNCEGG
jgi:hypothetical protein